MNIAPEKSQPLILYVMFVGAGFLLLLYFLLFYVRDIRISDATIYVRQGNSEIQFSANSLSDIELQLVKSNYSSGGEILDVVVTVVNEVLSDAESGSAVFYLRGDKNYKIVTGEVRSSELLPAIEYLSSIFGEPEKKDGNKILNYVWRVQS